MELSLPQPVGLVASSTPARHTPGPTAHPPAEIATGGLQTPVVPVRPDSGSHAIGFGIVVVVHLLIGYALLSGLAQKVVDVIRAPVDVRLIEEIKPPPPPPPEPVKQLVKVAPKVAPPPPAYVPPPQVTVVAPPPAPVITAVSETPPPPAPLAPPVAAPPAPVRVAEAVAIGVACPNMVKPILPRRAEEEGIGGSVRAQATIRGGKVVAVEILSSKPRGLFDSAVRTAMLQCGCESNGAEIVATQNFQFRTAE